MTGRNPIRPKVRVVLEWWWNTYRSAPDGASVADLAIHQLGVELGRTHKNGNFDEVYTTEMEYAFGAKLCRRNCVDTYYPVEYFAYNPFRKSS
jgi:hypothetical protein